MRHIFLAAITLCLCFGLLPPDVQAGYIINHLNVSQADSIPQTYSDRIRTMDIFFGHRSVGFNILSGIDSLKSANPARFSINRISFSAYDPDYSWFNGANGIADIEIGANGDYQSKINRFSELLNNGFGSALNKLNSNGIPGVAMMKFCYVDITSNPSAIWNSYLSTLTNLQTAYPITQFVFWTIPLSTISGNEDRNILNQSIRTHTNGKNVVFDLADIETYAPNGNRCCATDRLGINGTCAANATPVLCQQYFDASDPYNDDGHLVSALGQERVARAWWVLMANIAGWSGNGSPTVTPVATPTPTTIPGDANGDRHVDDLDFAIWANNYGITNATGPGQGDFNRDLRVDDLDYTIWANNYGR